MSMDLGSFIGTVKAPSAPALPFETVGTFHDLEVTEVQQKQKTDFETGDMETWPDGNPVMQLVITGKVAESYRTDDDDTLLRRFYAPKPSAKLKAIVEGLQAAGEIEPKPGGKMRITYTGDGQRQAGKKGNPPKLYTVQYKAPPANADFLGTTSSQGSANGGGLSAPAGKAPQDDAPPF